MIKLAIAGAAGRMGRALVEACYQNSQTELGCAVEHAGSGLIGADAGELAGVGRLDVPIGYDLTAAEFDVLIDFTTPEATLRHARWCHGAGRRMVIGTTGFNAQEKDEIVALSGETAVVMAPNMSVGVNLCFRLVELAAKTLGEDADIEIIEAHHKHKVDAPSGTALKMGEIAASAVGRNLADCAVYGRQGQTGPRDTETIGFSTIRAGDIIGEHTALFAGAGERVEIIHRSSSRMNFAMGALRAAIWCMQRDRGLFDMQDVLGLSG